MYFVLWFSAIDCRDFHPSSTLLWMGFWIDLVRAITSLGICIISLNTAVASMAFEFPFDSGLT